MDKLKAILVASILLIVSMPSNADYRFRRGWDAYQDGDYEAAIKWYEQAAQDGYANAQYNLARMYQNGEGVTRDYGAAIKWYKRAIKQTHSNAQYNLGMMYVRGKGVAVDYKAAAELFKKASSMGHRDSQNNLGYMYSQGYGVAKDYTRAYMWLDISASKGHKKAKVSLKKVKSLMNPTQIEAGQDLVYECVEKNYKGC